MECVMPKQIAILGWGSLLWECESEFDRWHDEWRFDGPVIKIELSRVSSSRLNALTLVVDLVHGVETQVAWCLSRRRHPEDVVADLRAREGTIMRNIGRVLLGSNPIPDEQPAKDIATWAHAQKIDGVVWTQLASNFESEVKQPFSVAEAVAYIRRLPPAGKAKAAEYIWRAPEFVRTPVRTALQKEPWFVEHDGA
jgi:hypothetical protein